jgi:hypothetical protein
MCINAEQLSDLSVGQFFPDAESENLLICRTESRELFEHLAVLTVSHNHGLRIDLGCRREREQTPMEAGTPPLRSIDIADHIASNAVQPQRSIITAAYIVDASPHHQEHLCHRVIHVNHREASKAVATYRYEVLVVESTELRISTRGSRHCSSTSSSTTTCPNRRPRSQL